LGWAALLLAMPAAIVPQPAKRGMTVEDGAMW